jgi:hypothetical protein
MIHHASKAAQTARAKAKALRVLSDAGDLDQVSYFQAAFLLQGQDGYLLRCILPIGSTNGGKLPRTPKESDHPRTSVVGRIGQVAD